MIKSKGNVKYALNGSQLELYVCGEIDHHNAVKIRQEADKLINEHLPKDLVLDMSKVDFMDSSGLGFIMGRYTLVSKYGGSVVIKRPAKCVEKMCRLAGLERIVKIEK